MQRALEWIEHHLDQPFTVAELARTMNVGRTALSRLFRGHLNISVARHIRQLRVRRAQAMLTQTDLPIKVVAIRSGLSDPHHFNKMIRRTLGASPTAIRKGGGSERL